MNHDNVLENRIKKIVNQETIIRSQTIALVYYN